MDCIATVIPCLVNRRGGDRASPAGDTEPENVPDPTVIGTELAETVSMPLRPSVAVPLIDITSAMVLEPSAGELMSMAGSVRSMWMLLTVAVTDELPALSAQWFERIAQSPRQNSSC